MVSPLVGLTDIFENGGKIVHWRRYSPFQVEGGWGVGKPTSINTGVDSSGRS